MLFAKEGESHGWLGGTRAGSRCGPPPTLSRCALVLEARNTGSCRNVQPQKVLAYELVFPPLARELYLPRAKSQAFKSALE